MEYYEVPELTNSDIRRLARRALQGRWSRALLPMLIITLALLLPALVQYWDLLSSGLLDAETTQDLQKMVQKFNEQETGLFSSFLSFFSFLCTGAFSLAAAALSIRILRNETFTAGVAFTGFRQFFQAFLVDLLISVFSMLWALITVFPGTVIMTVGLQFGLLALPGIAIFIGALVAYILLVLRYSMAFFIAQDNASLSALEVIRYSVTLMKTRVKQFFSLQLSFIGWIILAVLPMSAGMGFMAISADTESTSLRGIAILLTAIGFLTVAMLQLYMNTAEAVYYSAISGNFGIAGKPDELSDRSTEQALESDPDSQDQAPGIATEESTDTVPDILSEAEEVPADEILPDASASEEQETDD